MIQQLTQPHIGGVEFFRFPDLKSLTVEGYFECLNILTPLLKDKNFADVTPAYYINYITNPDDGSNSLRITYFTIDPARTVASLHDFLETHAEQIVRFLSVWSFEPTATTALEMPNEEELKFRNFLSTNTKIAIEVIEQGNVEAFRDAVKSYRYLDLPQHISPKVRFEILFTESSAYFRALKDQSLDEQYWRELVHLFHGREFGLHFLVNMLAIEEAPYQKEFFAKDWIV